MLFYNENVNTLHLVDAAADLLYVHPDFVGGLFSGGLGQGKCGRGYSEATAMYAPPGPIVEIIAPRGRAGNSAMSLPTFSRGA